MADERSSDWSPDHNNEDRRYLRWQERTQQQLGFLNNVLIVLGGGLIGFALTTAANGGLSRGRWQDRLAGGALIFVMVSVAFGLVLAANRLRALRMTSEMARVDFIRRKLREVVIRPELDPANRTRIRRGFRIDRRLDDLARHYKRWRYWGRLVHSSQATALHDAASSGLSKISEFRSSHDDLSICDEDSRLTLSDELRDKAGAAARQWTDAAD